jgi:hypothetical protein
MTSFDDRQKAFENKFAHDEELMFKALARRRKFLGMWAAEQMNLDEEDTLRYALEIVQFGIENKQEGAVVNRILADMREKGLPITEADIRDKMEVLGTKCTKQLSE